MDARQVLLLVKQQLQGNEDREEIERVLGAAGLPQDLIPALVEQILTERAATPTAETTTNCPSAVPRLLVDWGDYPRIGHQARPRFMLICPEAYPGRPRFTIRVDEELDHDPDSPLRCLVSEGERLWGFHLPFRLTTDSRDCRPGQYLVDVAVEFDEVASPTLPRCFRCAIRLRIPPPGGPAEQTLEIDGDGQSIVNLHGYDLTRFSRVVLKGGGHGVINLQNPNLGESPAETTDGPTEQEPAGITHEYTLTVDRERQQQLPQRSPRFLERSRLESAALICSDGRRILLLPKHRLTCGRNRNSDVVLRFLPPNEQNDACSKHISRTHMTLELSDAGLWIKDQSTTGLDIDFKTVEQQMLLTPERTGDRIRLELGTTRDVDDFFQMELQLFCDDPQTRQKSEQHDERYAGAVGELVSPLCRLAQQSRIDAVRLRRINNLSDEEQYVLLFRQALIGSSDATVPVSISDSLLQPVQARILYIGRSFWLENLGTPDVVRVEGEPLPPRELVPLVVGMKLTFGQQELRFEKAVQQYL